MSETRGIKMYKLKKLFIVLALISTSLLNISCSLESKALKTSLDKCKNNGGLNIIFINLNNVKAICNNDAQFIINY